MNAKGSGWSYESNDGTRCNSCKTFVSSKPKDECKSYDHFLEYQKNLERNRKKNSEIRKFTDQFKKECSVCHIKDVRVLDFHHVNGEKKFNIGRTGYRRSIISIMEEINKCIVLCCNCHRIEESEKRKNESFR